MHRIAALIKTASPVWDHSTITGCEEGAITLTTRPTLVLYRAPNYRVLLARCNWPSSSDTSIVSHCDLLRHQGLASGIPDQPVPGQADDRQCRFFLWAEKALLMFRQSQCLSGKSSPSPKDTPTIITGQPGARPWPASVLTSTFSQQHRWQPRLWNKTRKRAGAEPQGLAG